ncbi:MAG TPA: Uma2 family endonuclease [Ktedonobacteraceae bacterium]
MIATAQYVTPERRDTLTMTSDKKEIPMVMPADWVAGPRQGKWTYERYAALPDDGHRYEVVQGVLMMSPAPEIAHQRVVQRISRYLDEQIFSTKRGEVLPGPTDVVLSQKKVVQPDLAVLLNQRHERLKKQYVEGAPDLVVEVISPSTATYDRLVKYALYAESGVSEYWLVDPAEQSIEVFVLEVGAYRSLGVFRGEQIERSQFIPNETVAAARFFDPGWKTM